MVLVDDVNGLELATVLLNELNGEALVETGLGANGLFVGIVFGVDWLNTLLVGAKAFCCVLNDGKIGAAAGVPEGFGPPLSPRW